MRRHRRHLRDAHLLLKPKSRLSTYELLFRQFTSPIILILLVAAGLAFFLADRTDTAIILMIVLVSGLLGFWQERSANQAVASLLAIVQIKADVWRDGSLAAVPVEEVVPGDVVLIRAGDTIPGDCLLLESKDLFVDEATLTGETYPVEKVCCLSCRPTLPWLDGRTVSFSEPMSSAEPVGRSWCISGRTRNSGRSRAGYNSGRPRRSSSEASGNSVICSWK